MKKIISALLIICIMAVPAAASASDKGTAEDPMRMDAWQQYAARSGFDADGGYYSDESEKKEVLEDFNCAELYDSLIETWGLEGDRIQVFGYRFEDSESAGTMLEKVETLYKDEDRTVTDRIEDSYTLVKLAPAPGDDTWYLDLFCYNGDFIFLELCDEKGAEILDELVKGVLSELEEREGDKQDE